MHAALQRPERARRLAAALGAGTSLVVLLLLGVFLLVPDITRYITPAIGILVGVVTLSLPVWAVGLLATSRGGSEADRRVRWLAGGALLILLTGTALVLTMTDPWREVGDLVYLLGTGALLVVSVLVLRMDRAGPTAD